MARARRFWARVVAVGLVGSLLALALAAAPASPALAQEANVKVVAHAELGDILADAGGKTLYTFDRDEPNKSSCYSECAVAWPPLTSASGTPTSAVALPGTLGTAARTDGALQVTYDGKPLYYYAGDRAPGDANGQSLGGVWWVIEIAAASEEPPGEEPPPEEPPAEEPPPEEPPAEEPPPEEPPAEEPPAAMPAVKVTPNATLKADVFTDSKGMTLYVFTRDAMNASNCNDACAGNWPPLRADAAIPDGVPGTFGTTTRADGSTQVTYNGMPLYYFAADQAPGDAMGQGRAGVWFAAHPGQYPDTVNHWAESGVAAATRAGWVSGYPDLTFRPAGNVTRAEFVKMLMVALGASDSTSDTGLLDVGTHWARGTIAAAVDAGIINPAEYAMQNFEPNRPITRAEIAVMVVRALKLEAQVEAAVSAAQQFTDFAGIAEASRGHVGVAAQQGIIRGYPDGSFGPDRTATRAEAVVMVERTLGAR